MDVRSSRFELLHSLIFILAVPVMLVAIGSTKVAEAGQQPNPQQHSQQQPASAPAAAEPFHSDLRQSIIADLPNLIFSEQAIDDSDGQAVDHVNNPPHLDLRQSIIAEIPLMLSHDVCVAEPDDSLQSETPKELTTFVATAYCIKNTTACGIMVRAGVIAADPTVLPLGSIVKIEAGKYSGVYRVLDTGPAIRGRRLDIYMPCRSDAVAFGRRKVQLEVVRYGWGDDQSDRGE